MVQLQQQKQILIFQNYKKEKINAQNTEKDSLRYWKSQFKD